MKLLCDKQKVSPWRVTSTRMKMAPFTDSHVSFKEILR